MSVEAMGRVFNLPPDCHTTTGQRYAALAVADVVNDANEFRFWMSPEKLAEKLGVRTTGHVRNVLAALVDLGWLVVLREGGGRGHFTEYRWTGGCQCEVCEAVDKTARDTSGSLETARPVPRNRARDVDRTSYRTQGTQANQPPQNGDQSDTAMHAAAQARIREEQMAKMREIDADRPSEHSADHFAAARAYLHGGRPVEDVTA